MELVDIGMGLVFLLLGITAILCLVVYLVFGLIRGIALTWDFGKAVLHRDWPGYWGLVLGIGWFFLIGGVDMATDADPAIAAAPWGPLMILLSFGVWLLAYLLQKRERAGAAAS